MNTIDLALGVTLVAKDRETGLNKGLSATRRGNPLLAVLSGRSSWCVYQSQNVALEAVAANQA